MGVKISTLGIGSMLFIFVACGDTITEPCTVERDTLTGEYALQMNELEGGECGGMGLLHVRVEKGVVRPAERVGCQLRTEDWEQAVCTNHSVFDCDDGDWKMRLEWTVIGRQDLSEGIRGELYAEMDRWEGLYTCSSTYSFVSAE